MPHKKVLLVSPVFHSYFAAFSAALEQLGYEVVTHIYDNASGLAGRIENRLAVTASSATRTRIAELITDRAIATFRESKPDVVLVVKGDLFQDKWWTELSAKKVPHSLWIYDELRFTNYTDELLRSIPSVYSYSRQDTARLQSEKIFARYLPNGFDSHIKPMAKSQLLPYISFIGARYAERESLLRDLASAGAPVMAYGREWSRNPIDVLRTGRFQGVPFKTSGNVTRQKSYAIMRDSLASINHHGTHSGFNLRLFEACGVGGLHLVDRAEVSEFYVPGEEVLVYESVEDVIESMNRAKTDSVWLEKIKTAARERTLAHHTLVQRFDYWLRDFL